jgi:hypothetical protein
MSTFREDMKISFSVELENPHVIQKNQIWVGALANGPNSIQLNSSYGNRDKKEYTNELGVAILSISHAMAGKEVGNISTGPSLTGGILVFFPSYGVMDATVQHWKESGMYERLTVAGGGIIIEPKGSSNLSAPAATVFNFQPNAQHQNKSQMGKSSSMYNPTSKDFVSAGLGDSYKPKQFKRKQVDNSAQVNVKQSSHGGFLIHSSSNSEQFSVDNISVDDEDEGKVLGGIVAELDSVIKTKKRYALYLLAY